MLICIWDSSFYHLYGALIGLRFATSPLSTNPGGLFVKYILAFHRPARLEKHCRVLPISSFRHCDEVRFPFQTASARTSLALINCGFVDPFWSFSFPDGPRKQTEAFMGRSQSVLSFRLYPARTAQNVQFPQRSLLSFKESSVRASDGDVRSLCGTLEGKLIRLPLVWRDLWTARCCNTNREHIHIVCMDRPFGLQPARRCFPSFFVSNKTCLARPSRCANLQVSHTLV